MTVEEMQDIIKGKPAEKPNPAVAAKVLSQNAKTPPPSTSQAAVGAMSNDAVAAQERNAKAIEQADAAKAEAAKGNQPAAPTPIMTQVAGQLTQNKDKPIGSQSPAAVADSVVDAYGRILMNPKGGAPVGAPAPASKVPAAGGGSGGTPAPAPDMTPDTRDWGKSPTAAGFSPQDVPKEIVPAPTDPSGIPDPKAAAVVAEAVKPGATVQKFIDMLANSDVNIGDVLQIIGKARLAFAGKDYKTRLEMKQEKQLAAAQQIAETAASGETDVTRAQGMVKPTVETAAGVADVEAKKAKALADVDLYLEENKVPINFRNFVNEAMAKSGGDINTVLGTLDAEIAKIKQQGATEAEVNSLTMYADVLRQYAGVQGNAIGPYYTGKATTPVSKLLQKPAQASPAKQPEMDQYREKTSNSLLD